MSVEIVYDISIRANGVENFTTQFTRGGNAVQTTDKKVRQAQSALNSFGKEGDNAASRLRSFRSIAQGAGYQMQDIAVQLQAGTSAMVVFGQQGSQIASLFGPTGAVMGAVIAIGAAIGGTMLPSLFDSRDATEELEDAIKRLDDTLKVSNGVVEYSDKIKEIAGFSESFAKVMVTAAQEDLKGALSALKSVMEESDINDIFEGSIDRLKKMSPEIQQFVFQLKDGSISIEQIALAIDEVVIRGAKTQEEAASRILNAQSSIVPMIEYIAEELADLEQQTGLNATSLYELRIAIDQYIQTASSEDAKKIEAIIKGQYDASNKLNGELSQHLRQIIETIPQVLNLEAAQASLNKATEDGADTVGKLTTNLSELGKAFDQLTTTANLDGLISDLDRVNSKILELEVGKAQAAVITAEGKADDAKALVPQIEAQIAALKASAAASTEAGQAELKRYEQALQDAETISNHYVERVKRHNELEAKKEAAAVAERNRQKAQREAESAARQAASEAKRNYQEQQRYLDGLTKDFERLTLATLSDSDKIQKEYDDNIAKVKEWAQAFDHLPDTAEKAHEATTALTEQYNQELSELYQKQVDDMVSEWEKANPRLNTTIENFTTAAGDLVGGLFTDGMEAFDTFGDYLRNEFKRLLSDMVRTALFNPIRISMGMGGSMSGFIGQQAGFVGPVQPGGFSGVGGMMNMLNGNGLGSGIASAGNMLGLNAFSNAGAYSNLQYGIAGGLGSLFGSAFGGEKYGASMAGIGSTIGMAMGGPIGAAIGALGGTILSGFFGGKTKTTGNGIKLSYADGEADGASYVNKSKTTGALWWKKTKRWTETTDFEDDQLNAIQGTFDAISEGATSIADQWRIFGAQTRLSGFSAATNIDTKGLSESEAQAKIEEWVKDTSRAMLGDALPQFEWIFEQAGERLEEAVAGVAKAGAYLNTNIEQDLDAILNSRTVKGRVDALAASMNELMRDFDGSTDAVTALANATEQRYQLELELLTQLHDLQQSLSEGYASATESILLDTMTRPEQYSYREATAQSIIDGLSNITDPQIYAEEVAKAQAYVMQNWQSLSDYEKEINQAQYLEFFQTLETATNGQFKTIENNLLTERQQLQVDLQTAFKAPVTAMETIASTMNTQTNLTQELINTVKALLTQQQINHASSY